MGASLVAVAPSAQAEDSPVAERAFAQIQSCVSDPDAQLNVLYVVDESGSLTNTDPNGVRAEAIAQSLNQLGQLSARRTVFTSIAMFAEGYRVERPWQQITTESAQQEAQWAQDTVGGLVGGDFTNWLAALQGAADSMDASPEAATACKVVVWMTDGAIVVPSSDGTTSATIAALAEICGASPENGESTGASSLIARLRTSGVNLIGVLLTAGETNEQQRAAMTYMKPIVEGSGTVNPAAFWEGDTETFEFSCGQVPIPEGQAAGAFIEANDPLDLAREFSEMFICIIDPCRQGAVTQGPPAEFTIDEGVGYFYLLIAGDEWTVSGPGGTPLIRPGSAPQGVSASSAGGLWTVEVTGAAVVPGSWTVEKPVGDVTLWVFSGVTLEFAATDAFAGEPVNLRFTASRGGSSADALDAYRPTGLEVLVSELGQEPTRAPCTQDAGTASFTCTYSPSQIGQITLGAVLPLTTLAGTEFPDVVLQESLRVQATPDYPRVQEPSDGSGLHQFTTLIGRRGVAQGSFILEGPARGDGQICFPSAAGVEITIDPQPERIPDYAYSGLPDACVSLRQGEVVPVSMQVSNPVSATGTVQGALLVTLKSSSVEREEKQTVAFTFLSDRKADPPLALLVGLGLLALALPIGLLYLQSTRAARMDLR